jgi:hypothetical protein
VATRLWTPADMVGVIGLEYVDTTKTVVTSDGTVAAGTPIVSITAQRPSGGSATVVSAFRDDFRPVIGALNGTQAITYDTATRQLDIPTKTNLPSGDGDKFWFSVDKIDETRTDDRYTWGYGGNNGTGVAYRMRQGAIPYSDVGSVGYSIGSVPVSSTGISIVTEQYTKADTTSRASYNGGAWVAYVRARNTSLSQTGHFGNWPVYGNGTNHRNRLRGWGFGTPTSDDWARLQGWASWQAGDNGASLVDGHPYKTAAPTVTDGGSTVGGTGSASGLSVASAVGAAGAAGRGDAAGLGSALAAGSSQSGALGAASGAGVALAAGSSSSGATGLAMSAGTASATGTALTGGVGSASGIGSAQAIGTAIVGGTGTATGSSSATGTSGSQSTVGATGTSLGGSTANALGRALAGGTGAAFGSSIVQATSGQRSGGLGAAIGSSLVQSAGSARIGGVGFAAGSSVAQAIASARIGALGTAVGIGWALAYGTRLQIIALPPPSRSVRSVVRWRVAVDPVRSRRAM